MDIRVDRVLTALKGLEIKCNVPLSSLTSFRIGGPAAMVLRPHSAEDIRRTIQSCSQFGCPYCVLGNGTNVLAPDAGYPGMVIRLDTPLTTPLFVDTTVTCPAGTSLSVLARESVGMHLMGLETLSGIPGTVGGAVAMNAGAYGSEIRHIIKSVRILKSGRVLDVETKKTDFGDRTSAYSSPSVIVLSATFQLEHDDGGAKERMLETTRQRKEKQPLSLPSAGSVFKRPKGRFAGALIENCGLKGYSVGGAQVSPLHAGFIVNTGKATEKDVLDLIALIQQRVFDETGVRLEREIKLMREL
ncbi:MAG: UDP-N-acetylmuramate dehydrogenase [Eubacteriales bacterium]|nr:UDP-N-acetylmuramate dehydrogenase [Eubacteriales bacterium]